MLKFVNYYRCSTTKQDYSIDAQRAQVIHYLKSLGKPFEILKELSEIESGRNCQRPLLLLALSIAKASGATICVSRLDRLSRSALHILNLVQQSGAKFVFCDVPQMDFVQLGITAILSEREAQLISLRTIEGMKIARERLKAQNRKLGNPRYPEAIKAAHKRIQEHKQSFCVDMVKIIKEIKGTGVQSYEKIAECLTRRGYVGRRGGTMTGTQVRRILLAVKD